MAPQKLMAAPRLLKGEYLDSRQSCDKAGEKCWFLLAYFIACGASRLARYNVTAEALSDGGDKLTFFEGAPIPTSIVMVALLALAAWLGAVLTPLRPQPLDLPGRRHGAFHLMQLFSCISK
jgi:hypothetical protein